MKLFLKIFAVILVLACIAGLVFTLWWGLVGGIGMTIDAFELNPNDNWMAVWGIARGFVVGVLVSLALLKFILAMLFGGFILKLFKRHSKRISSSNRAIGTRPGGMLDRSESLLDEMDDIFDGMFGRRGPRPRL